MKDYLSGRMQPLLTEQGPDASVGVVSCKYLIDDRRRDNDLFEEGWQYFGEAALGKADKISGDAFSTILLKLIQLPLDILRRILKGGNLEPGQRGDKFFP